MTVTASPDLEPIGWQVIAPDGTVVESGSVTIAELIGISTEEGA